MLVNLSNVDVQSWTKNPQNVYIGRKKSFLQASKWKNIYPIRNHQSRQKVVKLYEKYIRSNSVLLRDIHQLKGKNLGCWCFPKLCHGNILLKILEKNALGDKPPKMETEIVSQTTP